MAITNHVNQTVGRFATGKLDIHDDDAWQTYTDRIDKMRVPQYLRNYQRAYDSQVKVEVRWLRRPWSVGRVVSRSRRRR